MLNSKVISNGILRAVATMVLVVLSLYTLYLLKTILIYLAVALVLTLIGKPLIKFFNKRLKIKSLAVCVLITLLIFVIFSLGFVSLFIPLFISQGKNLSLIDFHQLHHNLVTIIDEGLQKIGIQSQEVLSLNLSELLNFVNIPDFLNSFVSFLGSLGAGIFSVLFISFFFMKDGNKMIASLLNTIQSKRNRTIKVSINKVNNLLSRYFIGLVLQILILFVLYSVVLLIFGVENALVIATLAAFLNLIPYIGPLISFFLIGLLTMSGFMHEDFMSVALPKTIYVLIGFFGCQLVDNVFSQPLIYSNSVKSSALEIFLIILISGTLFGITGMVVAVPAYTVFKVILKEFFPQNKWVKLFTKDI